MKNVFVWAIVGIISITLLTAGGWAYRYYTAPIEGIVGAQEQIESSSNRISTYEEFYGLCADSRTLQQNIQSQKDLLSNLEKGTVDYSHTLKNISGMQAQLHRYVNDYNSMSNQSYTAAKFKSEGLPRTLKSDNLITCN